MNQQTRKLIAHALLNAASVLSGTTDLEDAILTGVKYNDKTIWPDGFTPPPSA
jgi:hypothetical protein